MRRPVLSEVWFKQETKNLFLFFFGSWIDLTMIVKPTLRGVVGILG